MSESGTGRPIVFTNAAQDVEVYHLDRWVPGSMIGWRHENDGSCRVMVRLSTGTGEKTAWTSLEGVQLPDDRLECAPGDAASVDSRPVNHFLEQWLVEELERLSVLERSWKHDVPSEPEFARFSVASAPPRRRRTDARLVVRIPGRRAGRQAPRSRGRCEPSHGHRTRAEVVGGRRNSLAGADPRDHCCPGSGNLTPR